MDPFPNEGKKLTKEVALERRLEDSHFLSEDSLSETATMEIENRDTGNLILSKQRVQLFKRLDFNRDNRIITMGEQFFWNSWLGPLFIPIIFLITDYTGFFLFVIFGWFYFIQYVKTDRRPSLSVPFINWKALVPLRLVSRVWGLVAECENPYIARNLIHWFSDSFGCNPEEAEHRIEEYPSLGAFFRRRLIPGARPIDEFAEIVSPADGDITFQDIVCYGDDNREDVLLEQVKGVRYSFRSFLKETGGPGSTLSDSEHNVMYQCVVYLSPKDYHRFHSPVDWVVKKRRHVPGKLFSVNPESFWGSRLHSNERVVYTGEWMYGFFSLTAVGALNVGSIRCDFDPELVTNALGRRKFEKTLNDVRFRKGEEFGCFNLGSTVVLLFEAPRGGFDFRRISTNTPVLVGQKL